MTQDTQGFLADVSTTWIWCNQFHQGQEKEKKIHKSLFQEEKKKKNMYKLWTFIFNFP